MRNSRIIKNQHGDVILPYAKWCQSAWCHFKGLQFASELDEDNGLLFVYGSESIANTSIHMFFVFFDIAVVWLDASGQVVDKKLAKPWRPMYAPAKPAQYFIEAHPALLERVAVGDILSFDEVVS
ncbi:MAG: DUF192 domain-containing protein [Phototrophicaceae bacterium]